MRFGFEKNPNRFFCFCDSCSESYSAYISESAESRSNQDLAVNNLKKRLKMAFF